MTDELRMRAVTSKRDRHPEARNVEAVTETGRNGRILVVDDRRSSYERIATMLQGEHQVDVETDPNSALFRAAEGNYELLIVSLGLENFDGLRLCSQLRSLERTRNMPILAIADGDDNARLARGLEIGINDYLVRPIDKNELLARVRTQIRKKRYTERLRDNVQLSIELAITDALTGLHNRRYMESHLGSAGRAGVGARQAARRARARHRLSSSRSTTPTATTPATTCCANSPSAMRKSIRGIDLACRYGGEEFVVVMPETDMAVAATVAERLRRRIATEPFPIEQGDEDHRGHDLDRHRRARGRPTTMPRPCCKRADQALYRAKRDGRNRVVADAA